MLALLKLPDDILLLGVRLGNSPRGLQKFSQLLVVELACKQVDHLSPIDHVYCGHAFDLEGLCDLPELVDIYFKEFELSCWLLDSLLETGSQLLARAAPVSVEIDEQGFRAAADDRLPILYPLQLDDTFDMVLVKLFALLFGLAERIAWRLLDVGEGGYGFDGKRWGQPIGWFYWGEQTDKFSDVGHKVTIKYIYFEFMKGENWWKEQSRLK